MPWQEQQELEEQQNLCPSLPADINSSIINLNGFVNQLTKLLELQQLNQETLQDDETCDSPIPQVNEYNGFK